MCLNYFSNYLWMHCLWNQFQHGWVWVWYGVVYCHLIYWTNQAYGINFSVIAVNNVFFNIRSHSSEWIFLSSILEMPNLFNGWVGTKMFQLWAIIHTQLPYEIFPIYSRQVPQQKNEYDCGLFVLYFIERLSERRLKG